MIKKHRSIVVLIADCFLIFICNILPFLPMLISKDIHPLNLLLHIGLLILCMLVFQLIFHTYDTLWRYAESREYLVLLAGMGCAYVLYYIVNELFSANAVWTKQALPGTAFALLMMLSMRFLYRNYRSRVNGRHKRGKTYVAIIGAGTSGVALLHELKEDYSGGYVPFCMLDDDREKQQRRVGGIPVLGPLDNIPELLANTPVTEIVFAISNMDPVRKSKILNLCAASGCKVHLLSDPLDQLQGKNGVAARFRDVRIEDLLGRAPVKLNNPALTPFLSGNTVLVTGGGGSIGSELCRQIAACRPGLLIILDIAENTTYELQQELRRRYGENLNLKIEIASVRDAEKIDDIFNRYRPQIVFHAAAHKHVPLMEDCPSEAIKNNVFGTFNVAVAARKYAAKKFVLISTDKAVRPTSVMGTTKYLCEQVLRAVHTAGTTSFAAVRFGNVLGSSGSVIPLFRSQIEAGGPVTVTDRRIIRYFMTIPEAVSLVLEAGAMAENGQIYVLDMGQPVSIWDLAEKMVRFAGLEPHKDIEIREVGLRPGEKLYEELLVNSDSLRKTSNEKIYVEEMKPLAEDQLSVRLARLKQIASLRTPEEIIDALHTDFPVYITPEQANSAVSDQGDAHV